jgi:hypothetical protein
LRIYWIFIFFNISVSKLLKNTKKIKFNDSSY